MGLKSPETKGKPNLIRVEASFSQFPMGFIAFDVPLRWPLYIIYNKSMK